MTEGCEAPGQACGCTLLQVVPSSLHVFLPFQFQFIRQKIELKELFEHWECQKHHTLLAQTSSLSP